MAVVRGARCALLCTRIEEGGGGGAGRFVEMVMRAGAIPAIVHAMNAQAETDVLAHGAATLALIAAANGAGARALARVHTHARAAAVAGADAILDGGGAVALARALAVPLVSAQQAGVDALWALVCALPTSALGALCMWGVCACGAGCCDHVWHAGLTKSRVRMAAGAGLRELVRSPDLRLQQRVMMLSAQLALRSDEFALIAPADMSEDECERSVIARRMAPQKNRT